MNKIVLIGGLVLLTAAFTNCNSKKDPLLLLPMQDSAGSSASPSVPAQDVVPASTGDATGGGTVSAIVGGSSNSGSTGSGSTSGSGSSTSGSDSTGSGSTGSGSTGGSSGSTGGSTGTGASGTGTSGTGTSTGSGSTGSSGDAKESDDSKSGDSKASGGKTELEFKANQYSHIEGQWYEDGTSMFTYQSSPIGYSLKGLKPGRYKVKIEGIKNWSSAGEEWPLPAGFSGYSLMLSADGNATTINVNKSEGLAELNVTSSDAVLLISYANPTCGNAATADGKTAICHYPPGNPANKHTIVVSGGAVNAHVKNHGDTVGGCAPVCANFYFEEVELERVGDASALSGFISGSKTKRNIAIAIVTLAVAAAGLAGINIYGRRRREEA